MSALDTRPGLAPRAGIRRGHGSSPSSPSRPSALALLVVANAVSMTGNVLMTVAVPWLVLTTTGSAAIAGTAVFAGVASAAAGAPSRYPTCSAEVNRAFARSMRWRSGRSCC